MNKSILHCFIFLILILLNHEIPATPTVRTALTAFIIAIPCAAGAGAFTGYKARQRGLSESTVRLLGGVAGGTAAVTAHSLVVAAGKRNALTGIALALALFLRNEPRITIINREERDKPDE